jgi:hypothetical protein
MEQTTTPSIILAKNNPTDITQQSNVCPQKAQKAPPLKKDRPNNLCSQT